MAASWLVWLVCITVLIAFSVGWIARGDAELRRRRGRCRVWETKPAADRS